MRKALKVSGAIIFTMVIVLLSLFVVARYIVDDQIYLEIVQEAVKDSTGHSLDIIGQLEVERSLRPGLVAGELRLSNGGLEPPAEIATVKQFRFVIELLALLKGDLCFVVVMEQPQIRLETDATGRYNWQVTEGKQAPIGSGNKDSALSKLSFPEVGPAKASGWWRGSHGRYRIDKLHTSLHAKDLEITAAGTVPELGDSPQARFDVTTRIRDLSRVPKLFGFEVSLPPVGPIEAKGLAESYKGKYQIPQFNARWLLPGLSASVTGHVVSLLEAPVLGMQVELEADTLDALSVITQQEMPAMGPLRLKSKLILDSTASCPNYC